jgi:flagellar hook protein FlgE
MAVRQLQTGVSGLRVEREAVEVVADNLANVNTPGFKRQRAGFEDVFSGDAGIGTGGGARLNDVQQLFTQGAVTNTGVATDLAISGDGFFAVAGSVSGVTSVFYTRAGAFHFDPSGTLVDPQGLKLLGRPALPNGQLAAAIQPMVVPTAAVPARATSQVGMVLNLDSTKPVPTTPFDLADPSGTASTATSIEIFDSLGAPHSLDLYFNKLADNSWEYRAVARGDDLDPAQPGVDVEVGSGSLTFTTDGALDSVTEDQAISLSFAQATPGQAITLDFGPTIASGGSGLEGATQFGMASGVSSQSQDGYPSGDLSGVSIDPNGLVQAAFTNGRRITVGQLQLAVFRSTDGLARAGTGLWLETKESGSPVLGAPGGGGRGTLSAGAIEQSNVDMGEEMVSLIQHQRAFGANSKVINAADDMLSQLMQIKR